MANKQVKLLHFFSGVSFMIVPAIFIIDNICLHLTYSSCEERTGCTLVDLTLYAQIQSDLVLTVTLACRLK